MKKEEWINDIMESVSEIQEAEPNPYLYSKILNSLNSQQANNRELAFKYRLAWIGTIIIIICINVSAYVFYISNNHKQKEVAEIEAFSNEMISGTTYNYLSYGK